MRTATPTGLTDLRVRPLAEVDGNDVDRVLGRVLPEAISVETLSVAAFNSSI
ncbi:hypothetical protein Psi02_79260 [Planotetraspora silvatica]|uniref:FXSXX-COOH protein n=1 Tax=Planotetraspora silvatica TaxID=234614 RepID=A0A8J3XR18_9ACTN|nr:hypothetical protein [Planotetraspora silvatica]GII51502.1 hypothetical protein Psi02_79260 [Planotetraspora silvatica]